MSRVEREEGRAEYFMRMFRDPVTGVIPANIRNREIAFAENLPKRDQISGQLASWVEIGPNDVGGRTRALIVDVDNNQTIIAGGVNGGIWKSTDHGITWALKSRPGLGVTSIAQDATGGGVHNTLYAGTGERSGSADAPGAFDYGEGLWKSTDKGETWTCIQGCAPDLEFNSQWDFIDRVVVSPTTGTVLIASNNFGIYRSTDGGTTFSNVLDGDSNTDLAVAPTGRLLASVGHSVEADRGVFVSNSDGASWIKVSLSSDSGVSTEYERGIVAISSSNPNIAYSLIFTGSQLQTSPGTHDEMRLDVLNLSSNTSVDRSANVPKYGAQGNGFFNTQGAYNMTLAVHPTDPSHVIVGGTSLFRTRTGFSTPPVDTPAGQADGWIGGYAVADDVSLYLNQHPDQHGTVFDGNAVWSCHDGGLSYVADITPVISTGNSVPWSNRDTGYNNTQFYDIELHPAMGDNRRGGGLQDNGTPFFRAGVGTSEDVSSGDGAFTDFGPTLMVTSSQNAGMSRYLYDGSGNPQFDGEIKPAGLDGILFVHPYTLDHNNDQVLYLPGGTVMWRNNDVFNADDTVGWTELVNVTSINDMTALEVSVSNPPSRLYYAASDFNGGGAPELYRLDNAQSATNGEVNISNPAWPVGGYIRDIAVNPQDGSEIIVVFSNYNVPSIWHSSDAGATWTDIEGNLKGANGPSVRAVSILQKSSVGAKQYLLGTSAGLFSATNTVSGHKTIVQNKALATWTRESYKGIGTVPVAAIEYRANDGTVVVGTHGRGAWNSVISLPLLGELPNFRAETSGQNVTLKWSTTSETGSVGFEVEHQTMTGVWETLGFVEGAGTTLKAQDYDFEVLALNAGIHSFRLKHIGEDNAFGYSDVIDTRVNPVAPKGSSAPRSLSR